MIIEYVEEVKNAIKESPSLHRCKYLIPERIEQAIDFLSILYLFIERYFEENMACNHTISRNVVKSNFFYIEKKNMQIG